jgi:phosphate acetyltransferase
VLRAWGATTEITTIEAKFTKPMWLGETITYTGMVTELHPLGGGRDYVVLAMKARDSVGDVVGVSTLSVRRTT